MKYKLYLCILSFIICGIFYAEVKADDNMYSQSLTVGDDGVQYTPQPEETKYIAPRNTEDKDKKVEEETNDNGYYYPYPYYPYGYPYYNQPFYGTPGIIYPGYRPTPPPPPPGPRPPRPPHPNPPPKPQPGTGMVIHTNTSGHGYNFGGEGTWQSRPVGYPNYVMPSRPSYQPTPSQGSGGHRT